VRGGARRDCNWGSESGAGFGTAGLRGVLGAGESRMNRAVVLRTTAGLGRYLLDTLGDKARRAGVVVGYDGRRMSRELAEDTACALAAAGIPSHLSPAPCPTPLAAFAVSRLGAAAGVMVTASHNPPEYNGHKVYWENAAQIIPPHDTGIAGAIASMPPADRIPRAALADARAGGLVRDLPASLEQAYLDAIGTLSVRSDGDRSLNIVYTPLHGVGDRPLPLRRSRTPPSILRPRATGTGSSSGFVDFHSITATRPFSCARPGRGEPRRSVRSSPARSSPWAMASADFRSASGSWLRWPGRPTKRPGSSGGVPTNAASVELQSFPAAKLVPIPEGMSDEVAAAFTLGAQTAFAMIRRLELRPGEKVLVTAGTSNTSLFSIGALRNSSVNVYAVTSSRHTASRLAALGVKHVIELPSRYDDFTSVRGLARAIGGFNAVIDPFSDVYLPRSIGALGFFGRYVTCGLANQGWGEVTLPGLPDIELSDVLGAIIVKNIQIIGNCLGLKQDLDAALRAWSAGSFEMVIDSVYSGAHVGAFIERTYNATHRFGKVVYLYS
jgi:NADPH:quinone reductase-like Zn-dependent oxidoreductase